MVGNVKVLVDGGAMCLQFAHAAQSAIMCMQTASDLNSLIRPEHHSVIGFKACKEPAKQSWKESNSM